MIQQYPLLIDTVLTKCRVEKLYSANDFRDIAHHLDTLRDELIEEVESFRSSPINHSHIKAPTRSLQAYTSILGGKA